MFKDKLLIFLNTYKRDIIIFILLFIIIGVFIYNITMIYNRFDTIKSSNNDNTLVKKVVEDLPKNNEYYYIDIKGAINIPNVYKLEKGSRIIDAINLAGGLTKEADTSVLNLSKKITDEMSIIIYTKNQIKQYKSNMESVDKIISIIDNECTCPDPKTNEACINDNENSDETLDNKIPINTATLTQLDELPGIGQSKAQSIIDYRNLNGLFNNIEDLKKVTGIGDSLFAKIKEYITL